MLCLGPLLIIKKGFIPSEEDLNHEAIHWKQWKELLLIGFILWYFLEFLVKWIKYKDFMDAYMNISLEREAYFHENDLDYLKKRKTFSYKFLKYL